MLMNFHSFPIPAGRLPTARIAIIRRLRRTDTSAALRPAKEMSEVDILGTVVRFVVSALVLMFVGFIVPGFAPLTFFHALLAALVIAAIGWVIEATMGAKVSPFGRGVVGFIISAIVIWATQFFVPGMQVSILGALLAAVLIGVIDLFVPTAITR